MRRMQRAVHKQGLFPVQRLAKIVASRVSANSFFVFCVRKNRGGGEFAVGPNIPTQPVHRKHNSFYGQPSESVSQSAHGRCLKQNNDFEMLYL